MSQSPSLQSSYLPLTEVQKGFYFQSLRAPEDSGKVQVRAVLEGSLSPERLRDAWQDTVARHQCLRSRILMSRDGTPTQEVCGSVTWTWAAGPWSLQTLPSGSIRCQQTAPDRHLLEFECHHALLDGWSMPIVLEDLLSAYNGRTLSKAPSYSEFREWLRLNPELGTETFWTNFRGKLQTRPAGGFFSRPHSLCKISFPKERELRRYARDHRVTFTSLVISAWALALAGWRGQQELTLGVAVSGRRQSFPGIEALVAPLAGVLPLPLELNPKLQLKPWLRGVHRRLVEVNRFEHTPLTDIYRHCDVPVGHSLFDSVVMVQDFPARVMLAGELTLREYSSSITSKYPINLLAKPEGQDWSLELHYQESSLASQDAERLLHNTAEILSELSTPGRLQRHFNPSTTQARSELLTAAPPERSRPPQNSAELALQKIWSRLFDRDIDVREDFFEAGGHSLLALALVEQVEREFQSTLTFSQLLEYPTIEKLAKALIQGESRPWSCLVPLQTQGQAHPLFCVHAQGGHVMHFLPLARALGPDIPVYGLQAYGLENHEPFHQSFQEMARFYRQELQTVQPHGPYRLLSHCQGIPIVLELAEQLLNSGENVELVALVDASNFLRSAEEVQKAKRGSTRLQNLLRMSRRLLTRVWRGEFRSVLRDLARLFRLRLAKLGLKVPISRLQELEDISEREFRHWHPQSFSGSVVLFWSQDIASVETRIRRTWSRFAQAGAHFVRLETTHARILEDPFALAQALQEFLSEETESPD